MKSERHSRGRGRRLFALIGGLAPFALFFGGGSFVPGCGGKSGSTPYVPPPPPVPDPGSGPFDCSSGDPYEFQMIEDFEYGAATGWYTNNEVCYPWTQAAAECADAGMVCYPGPQGAPVCQQDGGPPSVWAACFGKGVDCTDVDASLAACAAECASIQPSPPFSADQLPAQVIPNGGRCGSLYALHIQGGPFQNWGGNVGRRFAVPIDASAYDGIAMWMRTAPEGAIAAKIAIADKYTDSQTNMYPAPGQPQYCDPNPNCLVQTAQGNSNCYNVGCDKFGAYTPLTENWRLYLLSFDEMRQGGWGRERPFPDLTALLSIEIDYTQGTWDFWVDDIALYRRKPQ